jgi:hypothetical protein
MDKRHAQFRHAMRRANERYGIRLTQHDLVTIIRDIQDGRAAFVVKQSHRVSLFDVDVQETKIRVAYDKVRKSIATVLTMDQGWGTDEGDRNHWESQSGVSL